LSLDCAMPNEAEVALAMLEAIEQRAARAEVPVDARLERGRTIRHALTELMSHGRFDRMVVSAAGDGQGDGFFPGEVAWLLERAPAEVVVVRPLPGAGGPERRRRRRWRREPGARHRLSTRALRHVG